MYPPFFHIYGIAVIAVSSQPLFLLLFNYIIRALVALVGVLMLTGVLLPPGMDSALVRTFGVVFTLFGVYRVVSYYTAQRRLQRDDEKE